MGAGWEVMVIWMFDWHPGLCGIFHGGMRMQTDSGQKLKDQNFFKTELEFGIVPVSTSCAYSDRCAGDAISKTPPLPLPLPHPTPPLEEN